jgi:hypothetical protein
MQAQPFTVLLTLASVCPALLPAPCPVTCAAPPTRWGYLSRAGLNDKSQLCRQIEKYADVYTSRVANFLRFTPYMYFRCVWGVCVCVCGWVGGCEWVGGARKGAGGVDAGVDVDVARASLEGAGLVGGH